MVKKRATLEKTIGVSKVTVDESSEPRRVSIFITIDINRDQLDVFSSPPYKNSLKRIFVNSYIELFIRDKRLEEEAENRGYMD